MNNINEAIPPTKTIAELTKMFADDHISTLKGIIEDKNEVIEHMYSQAEMDEVMAINTKLEEEMDEVQGIITRLQETEYRLRVEIQRLKNIS